MADPETDLTVAVTGPTGTFGAGLLPLLQADDRVRRVVGIARRPFDPAEYGWTKMEYRRADVRDPAAMRTALAGADVVVHLAFLVTGNAPRHTARAINVDGTLTVFRAAAEAGARRFVHASSVAAYGWHADNPERISEDWPVRPAARLFYAREKAELEHLLEAEAATAPGLALYLLRPPVVLGPHAAGAKDLLPGPLAPLGRRLFGRPRRLPLPLPVLVPELPLQFVHEEDVGRALQLCVVGAGPPAAYNIAGDGVLTTVDVARELGALPVPLPAAPAQLAARAVSRLPFLPPVAEWVEAVSRPAIMDTSRAKELLGWRPRWTGLEALRATLR
ncbi:NAD-dependent epimerase/dehydratase family protein [Geodermatophilus sabuli]|uniref:Nucleoside-diphosphate-sugar epimerase n=1 Tax=Geodermatophilus sabuli TaxID=1564158 RepID=A0A285E6V2_9ACTN|nr:NAD-dependent epimerase/dehydratase family protein [Geodermatophilus sabuli]MBB3082280.1 nucleoside-diphosphate-sugar epimerase [Geodermatophilus sabuli]SNX94848.1 Nucleoside-diphosphate-sugar epimerase [Geodermatophilus sabuli]